MKKKKQQLLYLFYEIQQNYDVKMEWIFFLV